MAPNGVARAVGAPEFRTIRFSHLLLEPQQRDYRDEVFRLHGLGDVVLEASAENPGPITGSRQGR